MRAIEPSFEILDELDADKIIKKIEMAGRVCYKSENNIKDGSAETFISNIIKRGHESVLEHYSFSVRFVVDRGVSHEIVRHRIASYSQESTRYCNYAKDKFDSEITCIKPSFFETGSDNYNEWVKAMEFAEKSYINLLNQGATPQEARSVLPTSLKTEIIMSCNIREWRHFLKLRTDKASHPQIREVAIGLLHELQKSIPVLFDDITY